MMRNRELCVTYILIWRDSEDSIVMVEINEIKLWCWCKLVELVAHRGHLLQDIVQSHFSLFITSTKAGIYILR